MLPCKCVLQVSWAVANRGVALSQLSAVGRRMAGSLLQSCFRAWRQAAAETKLLQGAGLRAVRRMRSIAAARAFGRWCEFVQRSKELRVSAAAVLARMTKWRLDNVFAQWRLTAVASRDLKRREGRLSAQTTRCAAAFADDGLHYRL